LGLFGKSKFDVSQNQNIKKLWEWIQALNKNQQTILENQRILIKNNNHFIEQNKQFSQTINALVKKDKQHDALISSIKNMAKAIEQPQTEETENE